MKKFISMVMAAAMVVSLVPATAFAADGHVWGTAKIVDAIEWSEKDAKDAYDAGVDEALIRVNAAPELKIEIDGSDYRDSLNGGVFKADVTLELEGAKFVGATDPNYIVDDVAGKNTINLANYGTIAPKNGNSYAFAENGNPVKVTYEVEDENEITFTFEGKLYEDDVIYFNLTSALEDDDAGTEAFVSVSGDIVEAEDLLYASVLEEGIKVTCKEAAEVAVEEETELKKDLKIETLVGKFAKDQVIELELSNGFEFVESKCNEDAYRDFVVDYKDDEAKITVLNATDKITIPAADITIEALDADADDVCVLKVKAKDNGVAGAFTATAEVEVVKVLADSIIVEVEDDDVPVIYSGVSVHNKGITDDADHWTLEVTVEESVEDAWDFKPGFEIGLTDGVFVTEVKVVDMNGIASWDNDTQEITDKDVIANEFAKAYVNGDQKGFEFDRKTLDGHKGEKAEITFQLRVVAEPTFEGPVELTVADQTVTVAEFVAPYTVEAGQNDLIIDYRNTAVPTDVVIKEAEAGLWAVDTEFKFVEDKYIEFEGDPEVTVNEESEMEIDGVDGMKFVVDEKSDDEAAVVTISGIELYMSRMLAAGAYDLSLETTMLNDNAKGYLNQSVLYTTDGFEADEYETMVGGLTDIDLVDSSFDKDDNGSYVVKEGWINVITAGRDQDDASFTKKVVVPVGESYIVAGEETVTLDVPAYVSAAGYTMLPVRAVAVALGINTNNVLWDQATKTVTILYGQRIITMTVGAKVINVNGSAIPASASPEVVDGRTFLPMRDLATALGVTDITWDAATKTATLNGNK